jgi:hypothetical protein
MVPGREPSSAHSSRTLGSYLAAEGETAALVNLNDALAAIPGSYVKYGVNYNQWGVIQRWFVLPPTTPDCPCQSYDDFYQILKDIATDDVPEEEVYDHCHINGMGFCPDPDFELVEPPPTSPYQPEGSFPAGTGILPPVPPWALPESE